MEILNELEFEITIPQDGEKFYSQELILTSDRIDDRFNTNNPRTTKWRFMIFPNGNRNQGHVSLFLECLSLEEIDHVCVSFQVKMINPLDDSMFMDTSIASHRYSKKEVDWGYSNMLDKHRYASLYGDNSLLLKIHIKQVYDEIGYLWHKFEDWDSKKETGYVGLKNQGATCYLNSLLQSLYFLPLFKKYCYQIDTLKADEKGKQIVLAIQTLFYYLQISEQACSTTQLTKAFGWTTADAFYQHDVQELNRVLQDSLESVMKGTVVDGKIAYLFAGKMKSFIKCVNVEYESSRIEPFYDISLTVKGCKDVYESFVEFTKVEKMDGENQYSCEGYGLQDAIKGLKFVEMPPVLHLQLKRFEYDFEHDAFVKINDRHEFPLVIDLNEFVEPQPDEHGNIKKVDQKYRLQAVLVHSGDLNAGHYFALIRPTLTGGWYRFDDDKVIPVTEKMALEDNYGGAEPADVAPTRNIRNKIGNKYFTNAYMLVYNRMENEPEVFCDVGEEMVPQHLKDFVKVENERIEKQVNEMRMRNMSCTIQYRTSEQMEGYPGFDIGFVHDVQTTHVLKTKTLDEMYGHFEDLLEQKVRIWNVIQRQNKTFRVEEVVKREATTVADLQQRLVRDGDLRLFIETVEADEEFEEYAPLTHALIFFKYYSEQDCGGWGTRIFKRTDPISAVLKLINVDVRVYEEIKPSMVEPLDLSKTFEEADLGNGDILILEPTSIPPEQTVIAYFDYLVNQIEITFKNVRDQSEFSESLNMKQIYEDVVGALGKKLGHDPEMIRLYQVGHNGQFRNSVRQGTLKEMLGYSGMPMLGYELLTMKLKDLENKRTIKLWYNGEHNLLVDKTATIEILVTMLKIENPIRIFESLQGRVTREFGVEDPVSTLNEYAMLTIQDLSPLELEVLSGKTKGWVLDGFHFHRDAYRIWGMPFYVVILDGDTPEKVRERLAKVSELNLKELEKTKILFVNNANKTLPFEEGNLNDFNEKVSIGLDHADKRRVQSSGIKIN